MLISWWCDELHKDVPRVVSRCLASGWTWWIRKSMKTVYTQQSRYSWKKHRSQALELLVEPQCMYYKFWPWGGIQKLGQARKREVCERLQGNSGTYKSHSTIRARSKSCFWGWREVERTVQPTGWGKRWGIRRKFRLSVGDTCLMSHWDYQGCRCRWRCYEYLRMGIRKVRGKVIFPGAWCSLRNVLFRDHGVWSYDFGQEGGH